MTSSNTQESRLDFKRAMPVFVLVFVDVLGLTVILPLLHLYAAAYGATPLQIGMVAAAFPLAQLVGVPMMGALSDRFGRKPLLLISQITTCLSFVMLGLANSLQLIILSRLLDGFFGANIATAQAALSDITDDNTRTQGLGLVGAAFGLGFIFGPITALVALELGDGALALPAFTAAGYSFISILLTLFVFNETLPPENRGADTGRRTVSPLLIVRYLLNPALGVLLILMFSQQFIFFGFESLLGLFTLSRLGILGFTNAFIFLTVGITLVIVQVRFIGKWSRRYGEHRLVQASLALLAVGLVLMSFTPEQPHPLYVKRAVELDLQAQMIDSTQAVLGDLNIALPENENRGIFGLLWVFVMVVPLSVGAGMIRPSLNSIMTRRVGEHEYGSILGVSSSFVSAANASAPILGGYLFQQFGASVPFLWGGLLMGVLAVVSIVVVKRVEIEKGLAR